MRLALLLPALVFQICTATPLPPTPPKWCQDSAAAPSVRTVYQFPTSGTWLENQIVRSDGHILATELSRPRLWHFDPFAAPQSEPQLVHEFLGYLGLLGIVEYQPNIFALIAGNFSLETLQSKQGSFAVWTVDYADGGAPQISKFADVPGAVFLNGMAYHEASDSLLLADSDLGGVWKLDLETKESVFAIQDPLMEKCRPDVLEGINGLKVYGDTLWFTRGFCSVVAKIEITSTAQAVGAAEVVGTAINSTWTMDDLCVTENGAGQPYVAIGYQNLVATFGEDGDREIVAGNLNSTLVAEPTSVVFARGQDGSTNEKILYVTTGGSLGDPVDGTVTVGGQLLEIDLSC